MNIDADRESRGMVVSAATLVAVVALSGCVTDLSREIRIISVEVSDPFTFEFDPGAATELRLDNVNGDVSVFGDPSATTVQIDGERVVRSDSEADAQEYLGQVSVDIDEQSDPLAVRTIVPADTDGRQVGVNYEITVPIGMAVDILNFNGLIEVLQLDADVVVDNINGDIRVLEVVGEVTVAVINGSILGTVTLPPDGVVQLTSGNGNISLDVPPETSALVSAEAPNGTITVSDLTVADEVATLRTYNGRLGEGNGLIDLSTTNGNITLRGR